MRNFRFWMCCELGHEPPSSDSVVNHDRIAVIVKLTVAAKTIPYSVPWSWFNLHYTVGFIYDRVYIVYPLNVPFRIYGAIRIWRVASDPWFIVHTLPYAIEFSYDARC